MKVDDDSPHVIVPPPLIALFFNVLGWGTQRFEPIYFPYHHVFPAYILIFLSLLIIILSATLFKKSHTKLEPWKTTSTIVTTGTYRWSRNPIYLSFVLIGCGASILLNNVWILLMQLPIIVVLSFYVIRREELYLTEKFGLMYTSYARTVRRWI